MSKPIKHGRIGSYTNRACRCDECKKANAEKMQLYRKRPSPGQCNFCGKEGLYAMGLCLQHYYMLNRLMHTGVRTKEELFLGGYLSHE